MTANIFLKNGKNTFVDNLKEMKCINSEGNTKTVNINNLFIYDNSIYHFVGSNTVIIRGSDIDYLELN